MTMVRLKESEDRTKWFRDAKFGMFIHWGVYALLGKGEWIMHVEKIPVHEYEKLPPKFKAEKFNADEWMDLAVEAGMKYVVMTTKHHDGFCMFDSKLTDYKSTNTPFGRDAIAEVTHAAKKRGLKMGFYHSILDWHHPDYLPRREWDTRPTEGADFERYIAYMKGQIRELLTRYGKIHILWWDGGWEHTPEEMHSEEINQMARKLQPHIIINDRARTPEDFGTPEQFVPAKGIMDAEGKPRLWEACITITSHWWGYDKFERNFKSVPFLIRTLIDIVSKGGNLLLNVGPKPDGTIQREFVVRLRAMGEWLKKFGDAIYGTTASPFNLLPFWGRATVKGNKLYLFVFDWVPDGTLRVPNLHNEIVRARLLASGDRVSYERDGNDWLLHLPRKAPDKIASVVELTLDGVPQVEPLVVRPDAKGIVNLPALYAQLHGRLGQRMEQQCKDHIVHIGNWININDYLVWEFELPNAGKYTVKLNYACAPESKGSTIVFSDGKSEMMAKVRSTGSWNDFKEVSIGTIELSAGENTVSLKATQKAKDEVLRLRGIRLTPTRST